MTKLGFIRHGSTAWNKERRAQGSSNIPLDQDGIRDAESLADRIKNEEWDIIYSSDLVRAMQTAEIVARNLQVGEVFLDSRLQEVNGGQIEGTTEPERIEKWGENWRDLDLGIESREMVIKRALSFIEEVTEKHKDQNVLVVSHGSYIRHVLRELVKDLKMEDHLENTSVSTVKVREGLWECELYNCTKHLGSK
ncbi:histidine phosphatase family protein [Sutcliffiella horikoshii]|uniref:Histidine phosphatase family protein n=1 Tax=Sutcliffiella horikoshii TaxID=79883 RepID=A0A5D4TBM4_9BACI|nr:histidine phosphatase family protein [Sutcliffiella horikoshii]TYS72997.1 histidine phosphatase family protein [Sutcliffiella horikoshii]